MQLYDYGTLPSCGRKSLRPNLHKIPVSLPLSYCPTLYILFKNYKIRKVMDICNFILKNSRVPFFPNSVDSYSQREFPNHAQKGLPFEALDHPANIFLSASIDLQKNTFITQEMLYSLGPRRGDKNVVEIFNVVPSKDTTIEMKLVLSIHSTPNI